MLTTCSHEDGVIVHDVAANELSGRINAIITRLPLMVSYPDPLAASFMRRSRVDELRGRAEWPVTLVSLK